MIISKAPLRISLFGGSTDYKEFYEQHGSLCIGTTIDKYYFSAVRYRPPIMTEGSLISYSKQEQVNDWDEVKHPLIREGLKLMLNAEYDKKPIELKVFSDVPSRTGLGGSSSFGAAFVHSIMTLKNHPVGKRDVADQVIKLEREILKEAGGIQDQIWAAYGGLNSIQIYKDGSYRVRPLPVSPEFKEELERRMMLVYTGEQRNTEKIAQSHVNKDKTKILEYAHEAYECFLNEDIDGISNLLLMSWFEKQKISNLISTPVVKQMSERILELGADGLKLLGGGGCGFLLVLAGPDSRDKISDEFGERVLPFRFESDGVTSIYENHQEWV